MRQPGHLYLGFWEQQTEHLGDRELEDGDVGGSSFFSLDIAAFKIEFISSFRSLLVIGSCIEKTIVLHSYSLENSKHFLNVTNSSGKFGGFLKFLKFQNDHISAYT